jgi:hypothetical protein
MNAKSSVARVGSVQVASLFLALLFVGFSLQANPSAKRIFDDYREGDIVLQHIKAPLCQLIASVTHSPYSHCGLVVYREGKTYVLEAADTVQYTPLKEWLAFGDQQRVTVVRVKDLDKEQIQKAVRAAKTFVGKPYDMQYKPDDAKIYCSELVYKAFERGCKTQVGTIQKLGQLDWKPHEAAIRQLAGGELPLERPMITPDALVRSPRTVTVYSTFPEKKR